MFLLQLIFGAVIVAVEQGESTNSSFCEMIETETDNYYIGCNDPNADLFPHPEFCTLYIQCYSGLYGKSSITHCCPGYDIIGDGDDFQSLWFNPEKKYCDFPENVHRSCRLPVANISTAPTTVGISTTLTGRCHAVDARNESWEESFGETRRKKCPAGYARWFCDGCTGQFEGEQPDRSECVDHWIQGVGDEVGIFVFFKNHCLF